MGDEEQTDRRANQEIQEARAHRGLWAPEDLQGKTAETDTDPQAPRVLRVIQASQVIPD